MTQINAYLNFNGNCRQAMQFYKDVLGGTLFLQPVKETPMAAQCSGAVLDQIMHAHLAGDGFVLMASDMQGCSNYQPGNNFNLALNCSSEEQVWSLFEKLSAGGEVFQPLQKQFWGALFGMLTDQFGIRWMLNYNEQTPALAPQNNGHLVMENS